MSLSFEILRPDDLVALGVVAVNLKLDVSRPARPRLVLEDKKRPALLIYTFQPQSITEQAFYETDATAPPPFNPPPMPPPQATDDPLPAPGGAAARMAGSSRLVFRLPQGRTELEYSIRSLLNWSQLELVLTPVAAVAPGATPATLPTIAEPGKQVTALELPYRLILSPTALGGAARPGWQHARNPVVHAGRAELWHTRLARFRQNRPGAAPMITETSEAAPLPVRAVWSPDFVANGPLPLHAEDDLPFRSAMTRRDRDQIVILTSGLTGYLVAGKAGNSPYKPVPIEASKLYLSALGGWLSSNGSWQDGVFYEYGFILPLERATAKPAAVAPAQLRADIPRRPPVLPLPIRSTAPIDLVAWRHVATQGRDHYVRIVYDGYLYPFGHRASLIKVTERSVKAPDATITSPVAYMRQRMYIVVREPLKTYTHGRYAHHGREMPLPSVRIDTKTTPDIDPPTYIGGGSSFWVDVGLGHFGFKLTATDLAGSQIDILAPLIFVSLSETDLNLPKAAYVSDNAQRRCVVRGRKVAYADPNAGDTSFKTASLYFDTEIPTPTPPPPWITAPFLPTLDLASVTVDSISQLLGSQVAILISYYLPYLRRGLDPHAGVFVSIVGAPPGVAFSADKSGGFATPNIGLTALSARKGLVSGHPRLAAEGNINPAKYFGAVDAKLFGTIPLGSLIPVDPKTLLANATLNAPEIRNRLLPNPQNPTSEATTISWAPQITSYSKGPVTIAFNDASAFTLQVVITRTLDGSPPTSKAVGKLTNFDLTLLQVVGLSMKAITFTSRNHHKTMVAVDLASSNAIQFQGPLAFIQTLAEILPPGLFGGDGPSIVAAPTELKISYTLGLPPITCGMFSLQNIAIMTGLDLPYVNGKPGFEFAFASRGSPFLVTVEIFGGGGFVHVVLNADGVQMVEGAIEFGGNFAFDIGVASGGVHAMAGIYFQLKGKYSDLTGFVDIGGEVSVLGIISISLDLNLSLSWQSSPKGNVIQGRATLSISVHIIFFSISVSVSVEKSFSAGGGSDPQVWQLVDAGQWSRYADAFA
jgi:hypothetical protein